MRKFIFLMMFMGKALAVTPLQVGDILLQPLSCWTCSLIEAEEASIYSHMGMVVAINPVLIAEAFGEVRDIPVEQFLSKTEKGQKVLVIRPKLLKKFSSQEFYQHYLMAFKGKKYDNNFLWNNFDEEGNEKLYCSEFITKFYARFSDFIIPVKKMRFEKNPEQWIKYFEGKVPYGEWGNSPGDFERSPLFDHLGEL